MAKSRSRQLLQTTDLTLAAYLRMEGFTARMAEVQGEDVKPGHPQGAWEFDETPALRQCVEMFQSGEAHVEPQEFHTLVNQTRRELFSFLGIGT